MELSHPRWVLPFSDTLPPGVLVSCCRLDLSFRSRSSSNRKSEQDTALFRVYLHASVQRMIPDLLLQVRVNEQAASSRAMDEVLIHVKAHVAKS